MGARDHLAVGLDVPGLEEARALIATLDGIPGWLKVGAELFTAAGPAAVEAVGQSARVFLDTKIHDIPNTAASAVAAATRLGVAMLTLHTSGGGDMLRAAREAAGEAASRAGMPRPVLLGVTVLTSLSGPDLKEVGFAATRVEDQVARLVDLAIDAQLDGVVASPHEAARVRRRAGPDLRIVTPGVRPESWPADDQSRRATAGDAIRAGADVCVVARPVVRAKDPAAAARALLAEIERALASRDG